MYGYNRKPISHLVGVVTLATFLLFYLSRPLLAQQATGTFLLKISDEETGDTVPARVEIRGVNGAYYVSEDALPVGGDCNMSDLGAGLNNLASVLAAFSDRVENPYTKSTQFYSDGESVIQLPGGPAVVRIFKGPEYRVAVDTVMIRAYDTVNREIALSRWIDMPGNGWYSADDHLHIPRPVSELNPYISKVLQAEDLHVGNLLLMGKVKNFTIAPQHAHGPESYYQEGNYILAAGQENPRTHFLGHTITLGAHTPINNPEKYLIYRLVWEEATKQGALNGFAHGMLPNAVETAPHDGMAIVMPHDLLNFVEVLQFNRSNYTAWYDVLAMGFRVAPTAGTDYPCAATLPGHERFYTRVEGAFSYENWLDGVRNTRTFVTTGPVANFSINGEDIGSEIFLEEAASLEVVGKVQFDPERDDLSVVELVHNGDVIRRFSRLKDESSIEFSVTLRMEESSWFALRGYGETLLESTLVNPWYMGFFEPTSNVHTAPIWVTVGGQSIKKTAYSKRIAQTWLTRLENIERVLAVENMDTLAEKLESGSYDAVPRDVLMGNREELLKEVQVAKDFFLALLQ